MGTLKEIIRPYYLRWVYFPFVPNARPRYFSACWDYPSQELSAGMRGAVTEPGREPDFLFLPMVDWHACMQRTQHLARELAKLGHRCFYLNPHLGRQFRRTRLRENQHRIACLEPRIAELHLRLPREPVFHHRLLSEAENQVLLNALKLWFQAAGVRRLVQIVSSPLWSAVATALKEQFHFPVVYDCHDLLNGFNAFAQEIVDEEPNLFEVSDLVVFSADSLMRKKVAEIPAVGDRSVLLRNAVDFSHFAGAQVSSTAARPGGRKTIGYMGSLNHWFDVEAVSQAAARRPDWDFVLIGEVNDKRILDLRRFRNVRLLGEVSYLELPKHLAEFDVGLIPFLRTELTLSANPIKSYEYFSLGLPVVSTHLPEVELFGDLVYLAADAQDFAAQVELAARENNASLRARRIALARRETWDSRVNHLLQALGHPVDEQIEPRV